jgi:steroid 5-alpha reductase family enzyme
MRLVIVSLLISYIAISLAMILLWWWQQRSLRPSVVDVAWSFGVAGLSILQLLLVPTDLVARHWLVALMIGIWGGRLGITLLIRIMKLPEDGRYRNLQQQWKSSFHKKMFWFFQFQAFGCMLFVLPFAMIAQAVDPLNMLDYIGIGVWLIGIIGGLIADKQLTRFRLDKNNQGVVCKQGLWRYSRHPNYFFEWIHWCSYVFMGWTAPLGFLLMMTPLVMLYLLLRVTGIPTSEKQAIASRGEAYRQYQLETSSFVPLPPRIVLQDKGIE